jgi:hypothetical protein
MSANAIAVGSHPSGRSAQSGEYAVAMIERRIIRLLVRRSGTAKFLRATGRWTKKAEAAFNFPSLLSLVNMCLAKGLTDVELILRYEGDAEDRCFPLQCR